MSEAKWYIFTVEDDGTEVCTNLYPPDLGYEKSKALLMRMLEERKSIYDARLLLVQAEEEVDVWAFRQEQEKERLKAPDLVAARRAQYEALKREFEPGRE